MPGQLSCSEPPSTPWSPGPLQPFRFRARREGMDWRRFSALDVERVAREMDVGTLQEYIGTVTFCDLEAERCPHCRNPVDPVLLKVLRMSQLSTEYLLHCQDFLSAQVAGLEDRLQGELSGREREGKELARLEAELQAARQEGRRRKKMIATQQLLLQAGANNYHKCQFCDKSFVNYSFLQGHLQRRHPEITDAGYSVHCNAGQTWVCDEAFPLLLSITVFYLSDFYIHVSLGATQPSFNTDINLFQGDTFCESLTIISVSSVSAPAPVIQEEESTEEEDEEEEGIYRRKGFRKLVIVTPFKKRGRTLKFRIREQRRMEWNKNNLKDFLSLLSHLGLAGLRCYSLAGLTLIVRAGSQRNTGDQIVAPTKPDKLVLVWQITYPIMSTSLCCVLLAEPEDMGNLRQKLLESLRKNPDLVREFRPILEETLEEKLESMGLRKGTKGISKQTFKTLSSTVASQRQQKAKKLQEMPSLREKLTREVTKRVRRLQESQGTTVPTPAASYKHMNSDFPLIDKRLQDLQRRKRSKARNPPRPVQPLAPQPAPRTIVTPRTPRTRAQRTSTPPFSSEEESGGDSAYITSPGSKALPAVRVVQAGPRQNQTVATEEDWSDTELSEGPVSPGSTRLPASQGSVVQSLTKSLEKQLSSPARRPVGGIKVLPPSASASPKSSTVMKNLQLSDEESDLELSSVEEITPQSSAPRVAGVRGSADSVGSPGTSVWSSSASRGAVWHSYHSLNSAI
uniref:DAZ interacting zinc finger protein 1-like n=1 Tax=Lepisosteus oculatus TaxID=7918 RepID=W5MGG0_LEPOC